MTNSNSNPERNQRAECTNGGQRNEERISWDKVIPGLDPKTKRMFEDWDDIAYGTKDEPLSSLFDPPLTLVPADQIASEDEADSVLDALLDRLQEHNVVIEICDHFSSLDTYRWLTEKILPEVQIHPDLARIGTFEHIPTWQDCPKCSAEFDE